MVLILGILAVSTAPAQSACEGEITNYVAQIDGNYLNVEVDVKNTGSVLCEFRAFLINSKGDKIDKEPDVYWGDFDSGEEGSYTLSGALFDFGDAVYKIELRDQHVGAVDMEAGALVTITSTIPLEMCETPSLQLSLRRIGTFCKAKVKWEVKKNGESSFVDYSGDCTEGNPEVVVIPGSPQNVSCSSPNIPPKQTGPHTARLSWCGSSIEFQYGGECGYTTRDTCEGTGKCWWDDGNKYCKICEREEIEDCRDYPTAVWGVVDGVCPACIRNPCHVDEGPCQMVSSGFFDVICMKCDAFGRRVDECFDYSVASSCECDPCGAGIITGHQCDWGGIPSTEIDEYITILLSDEYGDAQGGTLELKCGATSVSGELVSTSGDQATFKITKEQLGDIFDAGCWYT